MFTPEIDPKWEVQRDIIIRFIEKNGAYSLEYDDTHEVVADLISNLKKAFSVGYDIEIWKKKNTYKIQITSSK